MISIKKTTYFLFFLVGLLFFITLYLNFFTIPKYTKFQEEDLAHIHRAEIIYYETSLSMGVLRNIQSHKLSSPAVIDAYQRHVSLLSLNLERIYKNLEKVESLVAEDSLIFSQLQVFQYDLEMLSTDYFDLEKIEKHYIDLGENIHFFSQQVEEKHITKTKGLHTLLNVFFIGLLLLIGLLFLLIMHFFNHTLSDVFSKFNMLISNRFPHEEPAKKMSLFKDSKAISEQLNKTTMFKKNIYKIKEKLNEVYFLEDALDVLFFEIKKYFSVSRIGIAFVDYKNELFITEYGIADYEPLYLTPGIKIPFSETALKDILGSKEIEIHSFPYTDKKIKKCNLAKELILKEGIQSNMIIPLKSGQNVFALVFLSSKEKNHFKYEDQNIAEKYIISMKDFIKRSYFSKIIMGKMLVSLSELADIKDYANTQHMKKVSLYAKTIALALIENKHPKYPMSYKYAVEIERSSFVYDIGKVYIPDNILQKEAPLTLEEWKITKEHPLVSAKMFSDLRKELEIFDQNIFETTEKIAKYHHERWDGHGYPEGLKAFDIPLGARIIAIADTLDALTSERSYKEAYDFNKSVEIILENRGKQFDPHLVDVFSSQLEKIKNIYLDNIK